MKITTSAKVENYTLDEDSENILKDALFMSMLEIQNLARLKAPADTGELRRSIQLFPIAQRQEEYLVFSDMTHAPIIEFGRGKGYPPFEVIKEWGQRRGLSDEVIWAVWHSIGQRGFREQPFMRPALDEVENKLDTISRQAIDNYQR